MIWSNFELQLQEGTKFFSYFWRHLVFDFSYFCLPKDLRIKNINHFIIGQLNIHSLRNKSEKLSVMISGNIDILIIFETKLGETFPAAQFLLQGFCLPYRFDHNRNGVGIMRYIKEDIPSRLMERKVWNNFEYFFVEINLRRKKWRLCFSCNPHMNSM